MMQWLVFFLLIEWLSPTPVDQRLRKAVSLVALLVALEVLRAAGLFYLSPPERHFYDRAHLAGLNGTDGVSGPSGFNGTFVH